MDPPMMIPFLPSINQGMAYPLDMSQQQSLPQQQSLQLQSLPQQMSQNHSQALPGQPQSQTPNQMLAQMLNQLLDQAHFQHQYQYLQGQYQQYVPQQFNSQLYPPQQYIPQQYPPHYVPYSQPNVQPASQAPPVQSNQGFSYGAQSQPSHQANSTTPGNGKITRFLDTITPYLPVPPLSKVPSRPSLQYYHQKPNKRKSKFTKYQDDLIVQLKEEGKSWVEIAEISKVGSYLAARNRYQVIIGQQGNNNANLWHLDYSVLLKKLLDKYEHEKWKFITMELNKATNKNYTIKEVQEVISSLFGYNPYSFQVNENLVHELIKEKKVTDRAIESMKNNDFDDFLSYQLLNDNNPAT